MEEGRFPARGAETLGRQVQLQGAIRVSITGRPALWFSTSRKIDDEFLEAVQINLLRDWSDRRPSLRPIEVPRFKFEEMVNELALECVPLIDSHEVSVYLEILYEDGSLVHGSIPWSKKDEVLKTLREVENLSGDVRGSGYSFVYWGEMKLKQGQGFPRRHGPTGLRTDRGVAWRAP